MPLIRNRRKFENTLLKLTAVLLLMSFVYLGGTFLLGRNLKSIIINALNEELKVKVTVKRIDLDVLSNFPLIAIRFNELCIEESSPYFNDCMLNAPELRMIFNPFKVLGKHTEVSRIDIKKGKIRLYSGANGESNFDLFQSNDQGNSDFSLKIGEIRLLKTNLQYFEPEGLSTNFNTGKLSLAIRLSDEDYRLKLSGNCFFDHLMYKDEMILFSKKVETDGFFRMTSNHELFSFQDFMIKVEELPVYMNGSIAVKREGTDFDLKINATELQIDQLISLMPPKVQRELPALKSSGSLNIEGQMKGLLTDHEYPFMQLQFTLENGTLFNGETPTGFENIELNGHWTQAIGQSEINPEWAIKLSNLKAGNDRLKGSAHYLPNEGMIEWKLNGRIHLNRLSKLLEETNGLQGKAQVNMKGSWPMHPSSAKWFQLNGDLVASGVEIPHNWNNGMPFKQLMLDISVDEDMLRLNKISGKIGDSDFLLKGNIAKYKSLLSDSVELHVNADWFSKNLNINDFTIGLDSNQTNNDVNPQNAKNPLKGIRADIRLVAQKFEYDSIQMRNLKSDVQVRDGNLNISKLSCNAFGGQWLASATIGLQPSNEYFSTEIQCRQAKIEDIFNSFNNFGQQEITGDQLSGEISGSVLAKAPINSDFSMNVNQLELTSYLTITNGRLKEYTPLYELSKFVQLEDLKDIRFDTLENSLQISEGSLSFPEMTIRNTALDLQISGSHTFNNEMDYHLAVEIGELLVAKAKWMDKLQKDKVEEKNRSMKVYLHLYGNADDIKISYDRKNAGKDAKEEIINKGKNIGERIKSAVKEQEEAKNSNADDWWDD